MGNNYYRNYRSLCNVKSSITNRGQIGCLVLLFTSAKGQPLHASKLGIYESLICILNPPSRPLKRVVFKTQNLFSATKYLNLSYIFSEIPLKV